ncbi:CDP-diacylglycerol--serine O-phosphatidyltransferase [Lewinella aquimaris]|uniref:CDP-diacylglycerol--serine O-phosphatidyltransferase n=1 Tax=Neolewinella aquimaris TaxID=1835722 RepID=A0A840E4U8_9BACT|nr:CDP-alcohol phosphatidyltransferase family protein [Neolewinella aquimaris]MBB4078973.1 CDP-diacylglycerol--serine O-phosphatidyltransferase [Neolewinella aquimaris]
MKSWIPNFVTLLNLFCGCAAIICILDLRFIPAFWFLFASGWFDFADGLVARALNVSSEHGKELDSLADMVSFGVVPAMIYYVLLLLPVDLAPASPPAITWSWYAAPALFVALFSALRLAKFNLDTRQSENFLGVATPTSTVYATGLMLIVATNPDWAPYVLSRWVLYPSILIMSFLLVSEYPMFSFKLKGFGWAGNETKYIFAALAIGLLTVLWTSAFPFIVVVYLILNLAFPPPSSAKQPL